jgi:hypothetical protein
MSDDTHSEPDPHGKEEKKEVDTSWDHKEEVVEPVGDLGQKRMDDDHLFENDIEHMHEDELDILNVNKVVGVTDDTTLRCFSARAVLVSIVSQRYLFMYALLYSPCFIFSMPACAHLGSRCT